MTSHDPEHQDHGEPGHVRFEHLLVQAVDGRITPSDRAELDRHLADCATCRAELRDFLTIKEDTDMLGQRILADARIEPPRSRMAASVVGFGTLILGLGVALLLGFSAWTFFADASVPLVVKIGTGALGLAGLAFFVYALAVRLRGLAHDPYQEIDQ